MVLRVEVSDPLPLFRWGVDVVAKGLAHPLEEVDDPVAWSRRHERRVLLFTVLTHSDWVRLAQTCREAVNLEVVAVLAPYDVAGAVRAVAAGAIGVLPRDASIDDLRAALTALVEGRSFLPLHVLRALVGSTLDEGHSDLPSPREIAWLRDLAQGVTVGRIADGAGYSERMMFRLLRELYIRMGAQSRAQALMIAKDREWI